MSELHKFLFQGLPVRGMLVRLDDGWRELLRRRADAWSPTVRSLLGEMTAAATLMQAGIRFDGALVLQIVGDGPLKLAVAEVQPDLSFRATATLAGDVGQGDSLHELLDRHGNGRCAITLAPREPKPGQQPYQSIVPLRSPGGEPVAGLAHAIEHYMLQSEQLATRLVLAANDDVAAGLLVQRLPVQGDDDAWPRISALAATLGRDELLALDAPTLLRRLFHEEDVRRFEPLAPRFACTCSRERVRHMLLGLGRAEVESILAERGSVEVACEFCGLAYRFDEVDVGELLTPVRNQPPGPATLQ